MSEQFVSRFIAECAASGHCLPDEIKQKALERIQEIDNVLLEADKLRPEKSNMIKVIKSFGYDLPKEGKRVIPIINEESTEDDLDERTLGNIIKVCRYLENHSSATIRELMGTCGITHESDVEIYSVVKWLCSSGIVVRTEPDRDVAKGPNWSARPQVNS